MKKTEQHQQAYNLYFQTDLSQAQIAKLIDVDRRTIQNWLSEGNWRQQKKLAQHMPSKLTEQYYFMLANLNHEILSREQQPYPLTHEGEQMRKITACIRNLKSRQSTNENMEAYTHLAETISRTNPALAAQLRPYIQDYVQSKASIKFSDFNTQQYCCSPTMDEMFGYEIRPYDDNEPAAPESPLPHDLDYPGQPASAPAPHQPYFPRTETRFAHEIPASVAIVHHSAPLSVPETAHHVETALPATAAGHDTDTHPGTIGTNTDPDDLEPPFPIPITRIPLKPRPLAHAS